MLSHSVPGMAPPEKASLEKVVRHNGVALRELREAKGLSLTELSECTGSHPQSLRNLELERRDASELLLTRIARALGIDIAAILRDPPPVELGTARYRRRRSHTLPPEQERQMA